MVEIKVVINSKDGKSYQTSIDGGILIGRKLGEKVNNLPELAGYELEITGGSDNCGFAMRKDIEGIGRKKILTTSTKGVYIKEKGKRIRKTVAGNTINDSTAQVNMKVIKEGSKKLEELFKKEGEAQKKIKKKLNKYG